MNKETRTIILQVGLFLITFITTTFAGAEWAFGRSVFYSSDYNWNDFVSGMSFSVPLLLILTVHEFGHYFTALYHRVKASLPYYIPVPPIPGFLPSLGTFGAVIRMRSRPYKNLQVFDIGLAGPLAGFVIAIIFLIYGFSTLPPADHIFVFHPEYRQFGADYARHVYDPEFREGKGLDVIIGKNLLFLIAEKFVDDPARIPNPHELMHYPLLFGVYFALFFTSLNLFPIGQLDGGHVTYGLFGYKAHRVIASVAFVVLVFYAGLNNPWVNFTIPPRELVFNGVLYIAFLYVTLMSLRFSRKITALVVLLIIAGQFGLMFLDPDIRGYPAWMILAFLLGKLVGVSHPPSDIEAPLNPARIILGWLSLIVFILCFSPIPIEVK